MVNLAPSVGVVNLASPVGMVNLAPPVGLVNLAIKFAKTEKTGNPWTNRAQSLNRGDFVW